MPTMAHRSSFVKYEYCASQGSGQYRIFVHSKILYGLELGGQSDKKFKKNYF